MNTEHDVKELFQFYLEKLSSFNFKEDLRLNSKQY